MGIPPAPPTETDHGTRKKEKRQRSSSSDPSGGGSKTQKTGRAPFTKGPVRPMSAKRTTKLLAAQKSIKDRDRSVHKHIEQSEEMDDMTANTVARLSFIRGHMDSMLRTSQSIEKQRGKEKTALDGRVNRFLRDCADNCSRSSVIISEISDTLDRCMKDIKADRVMLVTLMREGARVTEDAVKFHERMECMRSGDAWYDSQGQSSCDHYCFTHREGCPSCEDGVRRENVELIGSMWSIAGYSRDVDIPKMVDPRSRKARKKKGKVERTKK